MSPGLYTRRLAGPAAAFRSTRLRCSSCIKSTSLIPSTTLRTFHTRHANRDAPVPFNPVLEDYLKKKPKRARPAQKMERGIASDDSIFDDDWAHESQEPQEPGDGSVRAALERQSALAKRNPENMANVLDPEPAHRLRWERRMVIRQMRKRGRLTKAQKLKRTERESLSKSHWMKTSTKKLGKLARQIAGKPIDEAIVQMQFSKKGVAREVKEHLEHARNMAIVNRGLGLGKAQGRMGEPIEIQLKDGGRKRIKDRTAIYVDQAWVGRGTYGKSVEFRAKGRMNILHHPHTSISVLLKEETTRVRLYEEAQRKRLTRKLWLHLPDRPISLQRQYPLW